MSKSFWAVAAIAAGSLLPITVHAEESLRIGYWTSGVSLGYGAVLEEKDFLSEYGIVAEFIHFPDVNTPLRALASGTIDLAFGAPAAGVFSTAAEGVPIKVFAATQPADVQFVVPEDSEIQSLSELKGKRIGMSPAGSSVAVLSSAILAGNHDIQPNEFDLVGGNESRLAQFIAQRQVEAAALRSVTVAQLGDELGVRPLSTFAEEWGTLTGSDAVPYIGIGTATSQLIEERPEVVAGVIAALRDTIAWGDEHPEEVAEILQRRANLSAHDAEVYAGLWDRMNRVAFEPEDIETLRLQHEVFVESGVIGGELPEDLFATGPYELANQQRDGE